MRGFDGAEGADGEKARLIRDVCFWDSLYDGSWRVIAFGQADCTVYYYLGRSVLTQLDRYAN